MIAFVKSLAHSDIWRDSLLHYLIIYALFVIYCLGFL